MRRRYLRRSYRSSRSQPASLSIFHCLASWSRAAIRRHANTGETDARDVLPPTEFLAQFQDRLSRHVKPGQRLCVSLSGGVDSVVLLHATNAMAEGLQLGGLLATHVHHGLSPSADAWEAFCRHICDQLGIKFETCKVTINPQGEGVEASARKARYAALEACDCDWILLGHHRDDQAETVLLNLLRGAGVHGAAGMAEVRGRLLRPMLNYLLTRKVQHWP